MKKPTQAQIEKSRAARSELIAASIEAKAQRQAMMAMCTDQTDMLVVLSLTINQILLLMYEQQTGCKQFKTFHEWKAAGYRVKKSETAFRLWGRPIKAKNTNEGADVANDESDNENGYKLFPMCCLFNERQVDKMTPDNQPEDTNDTPAPVEPDETAENPQNAPVLADVQTVDVSGSPFVMQDYAERQEARRERLEDRADRKRTEADQQYKRSHVLVEHIPFGQPILVGHHSERAHRNTLDKSWAAMGKSVALSDYADNLESRAASVGSAGISSNDPEALIKLNQKLENLQSSQASMKAANRAIRAGDDQALRDMKFTEAQIAELKKTDFAGRVGFAEYSLQNNSAEIRRTKQRIEELKKLHTSKPLDYSNDDFSMSVSNGQVQVIFSGGKPSDQVRDLLKSRSFKWSRYSTAWVRKATPNAVCVAEILCSELQNIEAVY